MKNYDDVDEWLLGQYKELKKNRIHDSMCTAIILALINLALMCWMAYLYTRSKAAFTLLGTTCAVVGLLLALQSLVKNIKEWRDLSLD